jgi:hypothetical protein
MKTYKNIKTYLSVVVKQFQFAHFLGIAGGGGQQRLQRRRAAVLWFICRVCFCEFIVKSCSQEQHTGVTVTGAL